MSNAIRSTIGTLIERLCSSLEVSRMLDSLDDRGISLIHYFAALDYADGVEFLHKYGANVNIKAQGTNITPLVIAAARGHEKTVRVLMPLVYKPIIIDKESKKINNSARKREIEASFTSLPNSIIVQKRNSENCSDVSSDDLYGNISSLNSSVNAAIQNDQIDIVELIVRELSLNNAMRDCSET